MSRSFKNSFIYYIDKLDIMKKSWTKWAEEENKKKGWWVPIVIALIIFILTKAYKYFS